MGKIKLKKLFWEIVNQVENCSDTVIKNTADVVVERGMQLPNDYSVMFGLDDGVLRIYNKTLDPIIAFTEDSESLLAIKELFQALEL